MLASEFISIARSSELSGLSTVNMTPDKLLGFLNLGIIELSKKFHISTRAEAIRTSPYTSVYTLRNPDVVQILEIYDSEGKELVPYTIIGSERYDYRLVSFNSFMIKHQEEYVPTYNEITGVENIDEVSGPNRELMVVYKAVAEKVETVDDEIPISEVFIDALLSYVGYKANSATSTNENDISRLWQRYMSSLNEVSLAGYDAHVDLPSRSVSSKGFV